MEKEPGKQATDKWRDQLLPLALCSILPGLNFLNNFQFKTRLQIQDFGLRWLMASLFLLLLWYAIKWLREAPFRQKWTGYAIVTLAVAAGVYGTQHLVFDNRFPVMEPAFPWQLLLKLSMGSLLFWLIQSSMTAQQKAFVYRLEIEQLRAENLKAQLEQLQKQLDPHFLFNSLSTLRSMIRRSTPQAEEFVLNLSELYRQMLQSNNQLITLEAEMDTVRSYLFLIKQRYEAGLVVREQITPACLPRKLPFLAVQSLVENAIKHNSISEKSPLFITITTTADGRLSVENNRNPKHSSARHAGVGLPNLQKRYELLGVKKPLEIRQDDNGYGVSLPLLDE